MAIPAFRNYYFGLYKKVIKPYSLFKNVVVKTKHQGIIFQLHLNDWIAQNIYFLRSYEKPELAYFKSQLKPNSVFIDIGANIGLYALNAAKVCLQGKVYAFEPFKINSKALLNNAHLNGLNIIWFDKAVSNHNNSLNLFYSESQQNLGAVSILNTGGQQFTVQATTLDAFVSEQQIDKIDFIKLDIEGSELAALEGMRYVLQQYNLQLMVEIDLEILAGLAHNAADIHNYMATLKYKAYYLQADGLLTEHANLAVSKNVIFKRS
ncbi:MAG TPA: FkbM family methyltransferase [Bacteroidia bacterium]|nr:FkbM family methyltransferase [Bacteroidia bacterium]